MISVLISADAEWQAALEYLDPVSCLPNPYTEHFFSEINGKAVVFLHGGWGKVSAAATTQFCIDTWHPEAIINLGTCGGLAGAVSVGETLLIDKTVFYDIHERMSDPEKAVRFYTTQFDLSFIKKPYPQAVRVSSLASADQDIDPELVTILRDQFHVIAADWESAAIAWVAQHNTAPCLILRTVSDLVSEAGGEIYSDEAAGFTERSRSIMQKLLEILPEWIRAVSPPTPPIDLG
jgi:adenosylhomocysteine nucleosidase